MLLNGKTAIITGSNRGIGHTILETFAREGCSTIWAHARCESVSFSNEVNVLSEKFGTEIIPVYFDMTDTELLRESIKNLIRSKKRIDILVNNAGIAHGGLFQMTPVQQIKDVFDVNFFAGMEITQLVTRIMTKQKSGSIINMASISGIDLKKGNCAYGVSKAAVIAWTKTLSSELGSYGVRVNAVAPGLTDTRMATLMEENAGMEMVNDSAFSRLGSPQEIANTVLFLASDLSSFINGQVIRVDGGRK
ncbi:MAG: SDR family oxidoreductase [Methanocorpusculum sp.]|uniref:SDR family NAD(P)-dependent oxidoreductase n=1 Tax=Methanocorpusculum sp. TaxID=2058474 RepID=UPI002437B69E|nr:SDR family oxidoreductase [Methanocorpusculum sp.]MCK9310115.1 SDR family oxidoreductase [Candidatus Cloacimonadota bacterium]MDO9523825.1 SDR family oxidoreductase [Methanocorpusculum sp.]